MGVIGVDWGTSTMRSYLIDNSGGIKKSIYSDNGILNLENKDYAAVLISQLNTLGVEGGVFPLILSGMITSKEGWMETPYIKCPASVENLSENMSLLNHDVLGPVWFVPGVKQLSPEPDIMRGEETQLAGIGKQGNILVILPGTHSKWVTLKDGTIQKFKTFMTGDVYSAMLSHTILKTLPDDRWSDDLFRSGVKNSFDRCRKGGSILSGMFQVRVQTILGLTLEQGGRSFLSGILIGGEIAEAITGGFDDFELVLVVCEKNLASLYLEALTSYGITAGHYTFESAACGHYRIAQSRDLL